MEVTMQEGDEADPLSFYKEIQKINAKSRYQQNTPDFLQGHTFKANLNLPREMINEFADEAAKDYYELEKQVGAQKAIELQFAEFKDKKTKTNNKKSGNPKHGGGNKQGGNLKNIE